MALSWICDIGAVAAYVRSCSQLSGVASTCGAAASLKISTLSVPIKRQFIHVHLHPNRTEASGEALQILPKSA